MSRNRKRNKSGRNRGNLSNHNKKKIHKRSAKKYYRLIPRTATQYASSFSSNKHWTSISDIKNVKVFAPSKMLLIHYQQDVVSTPTQQITMRATRWYAKKKFSDSEREAAFGRARSLKSVLRTKGSHRRKSLITTILHRRVNQSARNSSGSNFCPKRSVSSVHFGAWKKYNKEVSMTKQSRKPEAIEWIQETQSLHDEISDWFEKNHYQQSKKVRTVNASRKDDPLLPKNLLAVAMNMGGARNIHCDTMDDPDLGAIITAVGSPAWIVCEGIKMEFLLHPGDVIYMKGDIIPHFVEEWHGERYSFVYFFDRNSFLNKDLISEIEGEQVQQPSQKKRRTK